MELKAITYSKKYTNVVNFYIIGENDVTHKEKIKYSLMCAMLSQENDLYPKDEFKKKLKELYNSKIHYSINEIHGYFVFSITVEYPYEELVNSNIKEELFKIVNNNLSTITDNQQIFEIEKRKMLFQLETLKDNKSAWTTVRTSELLYSNDETFLPVKQRVEYLKSLEVNDISEIHKNLISKSKLMIYTLGKDISEDLKEFESFKEADINPHYKTKLKTKFELIENENLEQAKINMVFKINNYEKQDKYKWTILNNILGGDVYSKLFVNVREKNSMCYYVSSALNTEEQVIVIKAGINKDNVDKFKNLIIEQIKNIEVENIDNESNLTKINFKDKMLKLKDSRGDYSDLVLQKKLQNESDKIEDQIKKYEDVNANEVKELINSIEYMGTYVLT